MTISNKILMIISYDLQIEILFIKMVWRKINLNEETIMNSFKSLFGHYPIVRVKKWYKWNLILQIRHHQLYSGHLYLCYLLSKMQIIGSQHVDQHALMFHIFHILLSHINVYLYMCVCVSACVNTLDHIFLYNLILLKGIMQHVLLYNTHIA